MDLIKKYYDKDYWIPGARKTGETFSIDSGLGGGFLVELKNITNDLFTFVVLTKGWERTIELTIEQAIRQIYCMVRA